MSQKIDNKTQTQPILIPVVPQSLNLLPGEMVYVQTGVYGSGYGELTFDITSSDQTVVETLSNVSFDTGTAPYSYPYTFTLPITAIGVGRATVTIALADQTQVIEVEVLDKDNDPVLSTLWILLPVTLGQKTGCWVNLDKEAGEDKIVKLTSSDPSVATVPDSVTIAAGNIQELFTLEPLALGKATITASLEGVTIAAFIEVIGQSLSIANVTPTYLPMKVGQSMPVAVSMTEPAPTDVVLTIIPGGLPGMELPKQVPIRAGQQHVAFTVQAVSPETGGGFTVQYSRIGFVIFVDIYGAGE